MALGVSGKRVAQLREQGMPGSSVEAAQEWYAGNVNTGQGAGMRESLNEMRIRLIRAQEEGERLKNRLREFEVRAAEESLVPSATADKIIETAIGPVLRALGGIESALKVKCNPNDPELAGAALREWAQRTSLQCSQALTRLAKRLS